MLDEYLRRCVEIYRFIFRVFVMLLWYCAYIDIVFFLFIFFFIIVIAEIRKVSILMEGRAGWFNENMLLWNWLVEYLLRENYSLV